MRSNVLSNLLYVVCGAVLGGLLMVGISFAQVTEPVPVPPVDVTDEYGEPIDLPVVKLAERYWFPLMEQLTVIQTACQAGGTTDGGAAVRPGKKEKWKPGKAERLHPKTGLPRGGGGGGKGGLQPVQPAPVPVP